MDAPPPGEVWLSAVISGIGDCFFGLAVALAKRGLLTRDELAEIYGQVVEQGTAQQRKIDGHEGNIAGRTLVSHVLAEAFSMPLIGDRSGIRVVAVDGAPVETDAR
jgi:hypothetical protein